MGEADRPVLALDHVRGERRLERVRPRRPPARAGTPTACPAPRRARAPRGSTPGGRRSSRARAPRASPEPAAAQPGRRPRRARGASSSAKNGFPPDRSWMRSSVWRAKGLPSRSRRSRWSAPTLSGPTGSRWTRSAPSACSSAGRLRVRRRRAGRAAGARCVAPSLRSANASAAADDASNHWRSSIATSSGPSSASSCSALRVAIPSARGSTASASASSSRSATSSARRLGAGSDGRTSSRTSSSRSPSPACASPRSASAGRDERTRNPARARMLDARQPERRLPDPRLALEHERGRPSVRVGRRTPGRRRAPPPCRRSRTASPLRDRDRGGDDGRVVARAAPSNSLVGERAGEEVLEGRREQRRPRRPRGIEASGSTQHDVARERDADDLRADEHRAHLGLVVGRARPRAERGRASPSRARARLRRGCDARRADPAEDDRPRAGVLERADDELGEAPADLLARPSASPAMASATAGGSAITSRNRSSFEPKKCTTSAGSTPAARGDRRGTSRGRSRPRRTGRVRRRRSRRGVCVGPRRLPLLPGGVLTRSCQKSTLVEINKC